jgi:hypothetical protein
VTTRMDAKAVGQAQAGFSLRRILGPLIVDKKRPFLPLTMRPAGARAASGVSSTKAHLSGTNPRCWCLLSAVSPQRA